ncbi:MAG TPA: PD-(D/E)XK nuclease-like domain-containing protein [Phytomonospora sp.]
MSIPVGIHDDIDEATYHADPALSASGAKTLLHSPARFAWERENGTKASGAMDLGTLVHTLVLRSHDKRLVVCPFDSMRTKAAQDWAAQMEAEHRIVVTHKQVRQAIAIAKAVHAHPLAGAILTDGRPEVTLRWDDPETGVPLRGRIDWLRAEHIVDLKTVGRYGGSELDTFGRQAASLDYPMSAANYVAGVAALTGRTLPFITITVEVEEPYFIQVSQYDEQDLLIGHERMRAAVAEFKKRTESGVWADPPEIDTVPLPAWYGRSA